MKTGSTTTMQKFNPITPHPDAVPPQDVKYSELHVEPWPEGDRVRVHAQITPFSKPPDLDFVLYDLRNKEIASVSIIENIDFRLVFTMHIRKPAEDGKYKLIGKIIYEDLGIVHEASSTFEITRDES